MELKQDDWDSNKSCCKVICDYLAMVSPQCWAATQWRLVTWAGVTDCWLLGCFYPGYLLFFSDPCPVSRVQCLPGDRVMTPPPPLPNWHTGHCHHWSLSLITRVWTIFRQVTYYIASISTMYKEVRPTWQKLNSPRRDQIGCILNHHFIISRIPDP